jgi:NAD+ synthase (glutamine-hydrolysing)
MKKHSLSSLSYLRVASVSPEIRVADVDFNTKELLRVYEELIGKNAQTVCFPELCISGYTCGDLFFQHTLLTAVRDAISHLSLATKKLGGVMIVGAPIQHKGQLYNCAVVLNQGRVKAVIPKTFLPNYNEFYEMRWFASAYDTNDTSMWIDNHEVPFGTDILFDIFVDETTEPHCTIGIEICEDLWAVHSPSTNQSLAGADVLFNLSASNETLGKADYRKQLVLSQSGRCMAGYVYSSAGAGESSTDVCFSGHCLIAENGSLLNESERFSFDTEYIISDIDIERLRNERLRNSTFRTEQSKVSFKHIGLSIKSADVEFILRNQHELPLPRMPFVPDNPQLRHNHCKEVHDIQVTALAKRLKHIGCSNVVLGLSGGLDSTLALLVCVSAFKKLHFSLDGIHCITMPGFGTTRQTKSNAEKLAVELGVPLRTIDITASVRQHFSDIGHDENKHDILYENAQARERTQILMDVCHQVQGIVIGTGDLSELALGWCTYNGDQMSMYAVNAGVPKTLVRHVVEWHSHNTVSNSARLVIEDILSTPISPELLPLSAEGTIQQKTEDTVGPYVLHDYFLYYMLRMQYSPKKIHTLACMTFADEFTSKEIKSWMKVFYHRFFTQQFKRSAMPDAPKVGSVALSPRGDLRMPSDASSALWLAELEDIKE